MLAQRYYDANKALSVRKGIVSALLSILGTLGYYAAYVTILLRAVAGTIKAGIPVVAAAGNEYDDACDWSPGESGPEANVPQPPP